MALKHVGGYFFNADRFEIIEDAPKKMRVCVAWDFAATEGAGDHTACVWMGMSETGIAYVLHVLRGQWSSDKVASLVVQQAEKVHQLFDDYTIRIPQDPGQAGKAQALAVRRALANYKNVRIVPVTGPKAVRARGWAEKVNVGNAKLLKAPWNDDFIREHAKFREDGNHLHDDQVDAASDALRDLGDNAVASLTQAIHPNPRYVR